MGLLGGSSTGGPSFLNSVGECPGARSSGGNSTEGPRVLFSIRGSRVGVPCLGLGAVGDSIGRPGLCGSKEEEVGVLLRLCGWKVEIVGVSLTLHGSKVDVVGMSSALCGLKEEECGPLLGFRGSKVGASFSFRGSKLEAVGMFPCLRGSKLEAVGASADFCCPNVEVVGSSPKEWRTVSGLLFTGPCAEFTTVALPEAVEEEEELWVVTVEEEEEELWAVAVEEGSIYMHHGSATSKWNDISVMTLVY